MALAWAKHKDPMVQMLNDKPDGTGKVPDEKYLFSNGNDGLFCQVF